MMMSNKLKTVSKLFFMAALIGPGSFAQAEEQTSTWDHSGDLDDRPNYLGVLLGVNTPTGEGSSSTATVGATLGSKVVSYFGVGLFGSYSGQTSSGSLLGLPAGTSTSTTLLTGQGNFMMGGFHLGGEIGAGISSWSGAVSTLHAGTSNTALIYGPEAGYDFKLTSAVSLGGEVHYLFSNAEAASKNLQALATLKVWL